MLTPFLSHFLGYLITAILISLGYSYTLPISFQGLLLIACLVVIILTPERYFDIDGALEVKRIRDEEQARGLSQYKQTPEL